MIRFNSSCQGEPGFPLHAVRARPRGSSLVEDSVLDNGLKHFSWQLPVADTLFVAIFSTLFFKFSRLNFSSILFPVVQWSILGFSYLSLHHCLCLMPNKAGLHRYNLTHLQSPTVRMGRGMPSQSGLGLNGRRLTSILGANTVLLSFQTKLANQHLVRVGQGVFSMAETQ